MSLTFSTTAALRFGTGFRPGQTPPESVEEMLAQLDAGRREALVFPDGGLAAGRERISDTVSELAELKLAGKDMDAVTRRVYRVRYLTGLNNLLAKDEHARFMQAVLSPNGFNERLAAFWVNHFSVSTRKEDFMRLVVPVYEAEAIRPYMAGRFADLVKTAVLHPAMLIYLDQVKSFGPTSPQGIKRKAGLNENLGRELLELHTLGAGSGYTQTDVRNAAYVLTGMTVDRNTYRARYAVNMAEPGSRSVFGKSYGGSARGQGDIAAMIEDLAATPETRNHICRKIAHHFLSDTPPPEVVEAMTTAWQRNDGDLTAVYTAMLRHPRSWDNEGQKAKLPFDYIVSGLRALSAEENDMRDLGFAPVKTTMADQAIDGESMMPAMTKARDIDSKPLDPATRKLRPNPLTVQAVARLGQPLWRPQSPAGFDDGFSAWIAGGPLADRIAWARLAAAKLGGNRDPRDFLQETLRDAARQDTIDIVSKAPNRQMGLALALASPEFNRR
ncbi:DUF1800 domain-containing protein [Rhizobium herbae]|uniref:Uncharacterized protein (DUF1800 family) n=1 Tax=Rhizobium herbae TaxID=508661 RepID=A0ABS4EGR8_9HYPH|nr:DUF1800 domain-containing protein [Rhizobium herbae]MBP1857137.1 uncharacterized protein (DUF1800 family) [Rhizobium herbae]